MCADACGWSRRGRDGCGRVRRRPGDGVVVQAAGASICRFKRLHPITSQKHQRTGAPAQRTGKRTRRLRPNTSECFFCGRSTGPHCRPIITNLTILFYIYSFLNVPPLLRHFRMIFVYSFFMFETLLVVWKQWNISKCSDQRIVKFVLYEWNIFKYF